MSKKILVVEDEPDLLTFYITLFEEHGFTTETALDGNEAARRIKGGPPDLIVLDLMMPEKSGVAFYRELRKNAETADIPVIMVTAFNEKDYPLADFKTQVYEESVPGPQAYLKKPIDKDLLIKTIKKHI